MRFRVPWTRLSTVILLLFFSCAVFPQNTTQIIASNSGKYCRVSVADCKQNYDTLILHLNVEWIDENLRPVSDIRSKLLLRRENLRTTPESMVSYPDFDEQEYVSFNRAFPLRILINKDFNGKDLKVTFNFEIDESQGGPLQRMDEMKLMFKYPVEFSCLANINTKQLVPPESLATTIRVISPKADENGKMVVKEAKLDLVGYASASSGINLVMVNSVDARMYPDGKFVSLVDLAPGENEIRISAVDNDGAITEQKITVVCENYALASQMLNAGNYYGLIIAVQDYDDPKINDLEHSVEDAKAIYNVLINNYDFSKERVKLLINPKYEDIVIELDHLNEVITDNDNLLIFYAGHGVWSDQAKTGYWLPSDARESNTAKWFRNSTLRDYIGSIKAKHTLLIADACFSGSIFKSRAAFANAPAAIEKVYELPSRKAMTSGSLSEVPDKSVFIEFLIKRLLENSKAYVTSEELFYSMKTAVINNSPTVPQFGEILNTGDEGGDFIFIRKK
jgi:hypothetical protein